MTPELWTLKGLGAYLKLGKTAISAPVNSADAPPCIWVGRTRRFVPAEVEAWALTQRHRGAHVVLTAAPTRKVG